MHIIPAIDLREGACARILGNRQAQSHIYSDDLLEQINIFKALGAKQVHITDLDGAFSGHLCNLRVIQEIVDYTDMAVQLSGGIRSMEHIDTVLSIGVSKIVLSASFLRNQELTAKAIAKYGDRVWAGIDGRDGMVTIEGFETSASKTVKMLLREIIDLGMDNIIYTDVRRYGSMQGPNLEGIEELVTESGANIFIAGGVSEYETISRLKDIGVAGIILGKALYTGAIDLKKAMEIAK